MSAGLLLIAVVGGASMVYCLTSCSERVHRTIATCTLVVAMAFVVAPRRHMDLSAIKRVEHPECTHHVQHKTVEETANELLAAHFKNFELKRVSHAR